MIDVCAMTSEDLHSSGLLSDAAGILSATLSCLEERGNIVEIEKRWLVDTFR